MENLLVMSLSGTTMTVICLFIRYRFKDTVSNNLEYLVLYCTPAVSRGIL